MTLGSQEGIPTTYVSIGQVYFHKQELDTALSYQQKALAILLPLKHPDLSDIYRMIGSIYEGKNKFYKKAQEIWLKSLPTNHPNILSLENDIRIFQELLN
jgi:tetratricopeptide (TPR) repeat protein